MMPKKLEQIRDESANNCNNTYNAFFKKGFDACYEYLMQNSKVVEIPESTCGGCMFWDCGRSYEFCNLCQKEYGTTSVCKEPLKPDFCKAKKVIIILDGDL